MPSNMLPPHSDAPSLVLGGLSIWVLERAIPGSVDWYEGSWLEVLAECAAPGAAVTVRGPLISAEDVARLLAGLEAMHSGAASSAGISPLEPDLAVSLTANSKGSVRIDVRLTPDSMTQEHRFFFDAELAHLAEPIAQCREILRRFPVEVA